MNPTTGVPDVADRFVSAIEAGDERAVRDCLAPSLIVWHNNGDIEHRLDQVVRLLLWVAERVDGLHYDAIRRQPTSSGYVQQHTLRGRLSNGEQLAVHACLVVEVSDGLITRIDEYIDGASVAALFS